MTQALDYERPRHRPPSRLLGRAATCTAAYPLLMLNLLYGQWLLSWWVLGHRPRPSLDDPKNVFGVNWLHIITAAALVGFVPAGCGALVLNTLYVVGRRLGLLCLLVRLTVVVAIWSGSFLLLDRDPGRVLYWWLD